MFALPLPFSAATRASLTEQLESFSHYSIHSLDHAEQLLDLNLSLLRASLESSADVTRQMLNAPDLTTLITAGSAQLQPAAQKALTYGRHLLALASAARSDFSTAAQNGRRA